ncbi:RNA guanine-N7 methyltransferase activating subunit-like [Leptopilina boulardi]|uniref:RNA guanine-N7 methyltransferase activating subunit-like n=1 Tax=Leptopilina boulardi TaxID=63433 RepID=UPI0021F56982|nr:RNA guanine-N7 methyltransferase activating subunit-like [Leptopilina boulardi]
MDTIPLTNEQEEFLKECEKLFEDRYSAKDEAFMKVKNGETKKPPIIDPWHNKPRRPQNDWNRQNYRHNRHNSWERHHERSERYDRYDRYDRHAGRHVYQRNSRPY